jgi:DNA-binding response OmpR family regulator
MEKLLVIEDSAVARALIAEIFTGTYELEFQDNGRSGLAMAESWAPDLILLDINLPEMDGYAVCRALKENVATRDIPVIFITSLDSEQSRVKGFEAGGDDYVVKPFYPQELRARVGAHLSQRRAQIQMLNLERLTVFREMAVAICHEINNPLTTILAFVHHLQTELDGAPPHIQTALEGIHEETARITSITAKLATSTNTPTTRYNETFTMIDLQKL